MPRLPKGSEEARQRMAHLRSLRKKKIGGSIEPVTPIMTVKEPPNEIGNMLNPGRLLRTFASNLWFWFLRQNNNIFFFSIKIKLNQEKK